MTKKNEEFIDAYEHKVVFDSPIFWKTKPTKKELEMVDKVMYGLVEGAKQHQADYMGIDINTMRIEQTPCTFAHYPFRDGFIILTQTVLIFKVFERTCGKIYKKKLPKNVLEEIDEQEKDN